MTPTILARFWEKVSIEPDGCWLWTGNTDRKGYGSMRVKSTGGPGSFARPHRLAYEHYVGPLPDGLVADHLCRTRACVNPAHIEFVTNRENILRGEAPSAIHARKTRCSRGHEFTPENTYTSRGRNRTGRQCKACCKIRAKEKP